MCEANFWSSCVVTFPATLSLHSAFSIPDFYLDVSLAAFDPNLTPGPAVDSSVQRRLAHIKETGAPFCSLTNTICRLICTQCRISQAFEESDIQIWLPPFHFFFFYMFWTRPTVSLGLQFK